MTTPRQRQFLLSIVTVVAIASTVLVAGAKSQLGGEPGDAWVGTWATALVPAPLVSAYPISVSGFKNQTIRMVVHTSVGGTKGRVRLSNRYGTKPLTIGHTTMARPMLEAGSGDLHAETLHEVTFAGQKTVVVPPGGTILSDVVDMAIPWTDDVAISVFLPGETGPPTMHNLSRTTSYVGEGDHAADPTGAKLPQLYRTWYFLAGLDTLNRTGAGAIVVLGDSISDGVGSTNNTHRRWTNFLALRLNQAAPHQRAPGILNEAVAGNRLGRDGTDFKSPEFGVNASARFAEDVTAQTGVRAVILQLGINDVWISKDEPDAIIAQMQLIAALAHQDGLRIFVCTLTPWNAFATADGVVQYTPTLDSIRLTVNNYLRNTSDFDGLLDFDKVLRDPADPSKLRKDYDFSDHIHPNDAGLEAMAKAIPLDMLLRR